MNDLIGCEYTATVRDAFRDRGHDTWSNDILDTEGDPAFHLKGDIIEVLKMRRWRLAIIHIPCTAMAVCGNKHYGTGKPKHYERLEAIEFSLKVWKVAKEQCDHVAMENPASVIFPFLRDRGADVQYIQPWQYGHPEQKKTGLALHNLPRLQPTNNVYEHMMTLSPQERERVFRMGPSPTRGLERSRFYSGIAEAMANQWGDYVVNKDAQL